MYVIIFCRLLLYMVGAVYFCFLTSDELSRRGYFDENALMTSHVRREFANQRSLSKHTEEMDKFKHGRRGISFW